MSSEERKVTTLDTIAAQASSKKLVYASTGRNKAPILEALQEQLSMTPYMNDRAEEQGSIHVVEFASGSGEHGMYFTEHCPQLHWTFSDFEEQALASIGAYVADAEWKDRLKLLCGETPLSVTDLKTTTTLIEANSMDIVVNINMIHISPWECTLGLMQQAKHCLSEHGFLMLYGPYLEDDVETSPGNVKFNLNLQQRNSSWGIRNLRDVDAAAGEVGLVRIRRVEMPANNLTLFYAKAPSSQQ